jgi:hypothetical protein
MSGILLFYATVLNKVRDSSPPRSEKAATSSKGGKDKGGKAKGKEKEKGSRPPSQQFDMTKPHWVMRIVSDGNAAVSSVSPGNSPSLILSFPRI